VNGHPQLHFDGTSAKCDLPNPTRAMIPMSPPRHAIWWILLGHGARSTKRKQRRPALASEILDTLARVGVRGWTAAGVLRSAGLRFAACWRETVIHRLIQLVTSCVVLGLGVALLLDAGLGADGYATLISGLSTALNLPFWTVNVTVGLALIAMAWARGTRPGLGTLVQPVIVGFTVSIALEALPTQASYLIRIAELGAAFLLVAVGVAGYLSSDLGAGPTEAAALAWDPPVAFKWTYTIVQVSGALIGFALGAAVGPGTLLVAALIGPVVAWMRGTLFGQSTRRRAASSPPA
jgi:uncharacterized membrane protein YczE